LPSNAAAETTGQLQRVADLLEAMLTDARFNVGCGIFGSGKARDPDSIRNDFVLLIRNHHAFQGQVITAVPNPRTSGNPNAQQLWLGELGVSEVMPRYSALAKSGRVFGAWRLANSSVATTAMTGLLVWNSSSGSSAVDLHILKASGNVAVTSASMTGVAIAASINQTSAPTGISNAPSINNYLGGAIGSGLAYTTATVSDAMTARFDVLHNTAAIATRARMRAS
jgi:hypothetical protein